MKRSKSRRKQMHKIYKIIMNKSRINFGRKLT